MASLFQITNAHKSYGDQVLLDGAEATISDNSKVGFVGRVVRIELVESSKPRNSSRE